MLTLLAAAWACDPGVLSTISAPTRKGATPVVANGQYDLNGTALVGSYVVMESAHPMSAWIEVLKVPESQDDWHPAQFGTKQVERLDPRHIFQTIDISVLWGAVHIRRHVIAEINWIESSASRFYNCWQAAAPEPWLAQVSKWLVPGVEWNRVGLGGWELSPLPTGGTAVAYQFWIESQVMFPQLEAWASSRTLPDLMRAFEVRVGQTR